MCPRAVPGTLAWSHRMRQSKPREGLCRQSGRRLLFSDYNLYFWQLDLCLGA